jgi:hypothetical protein
VVVVTLTTLDGRRYTRMFDSNGRALPGTAWWVGTKRINQFGETIAEFGGYSNWFLNDDSGDYLYPFGVYAGAEA